MFDPSKTNGQLVFSRVEIMLLTQEGGGTTVKRRKRPDTRVASTNSVDQSELQTTPTEFADRASYLRALRDAVADAAGVSSGLWITYLSVLLYMTVSAASVTQIDLFLERPVRLPLLNVDLPPVGFFAVGPALILIVHAYVLLHLLLLSEKIGLFHSEMRAQIADKSVRERERALLPSNVFVQLLSGTHEVQRGVAGFVFRIIAYISLVAGPVAVLILFQLQFLPFHDEFTTSWQRLAVVCDIVLLWTLWPSVSSGQVVRLRPIDCKRARVALTALASAATILLVVTILTFPGEALDGRLPAVQFIPIWSAGNVAGFPKPTRWTSLHELLVDGEVDETKRRLKSLWSNRLILPNFDPIDRAKYDTEAKVAAVSKTLSFRGRQLEGAILTAAQLANIDLTLANLRGAKLDYADLTGAKLDQADLSEASLDLADLRDASMSDTNFAGATLILANLVGGIPSHHFEGAILDGANLAGAYLGQSNLIGASLEGANLIGATLNDSGLDGAWLKQADLRAVDAANTSFRGAMLDGALLHGATIEVGNMSGASIDQAFVWRAVPVYAHDIHFPPPHEVRLGPPLVAPVFEAKYGGATCRTTVGNCEWTKTSFDDYVKALPEWAGGSAAFLKGRIGVLDPDIPKPTPGAKDIWLHLQQSSPSREAHENDVETILREVGCNEPYAIHGLLRHLRERFSPGGDAHLTALARSFLDGTTCPGAKVLAPYDREQLRYMLFSNPRAGPPTYGDWMAR